MTITTKEPLAINRLSVPTGVVATFFNKPMPLPFNFATKLSEFLNQFPVEKIGEPAIRIEVAEDGTIYFKLPRYTFEQDAQTALIRILAFGQAWLSCHEAITTNPIILDSCSQDTNVGDYQFPNYLSNDAIDTDYEQAWAEREAWEAKGEMHEGR